MNLNFLKNQAYLYLDLYISHDWIIIDFLNYQNMHSNNKDFLVIMNIIKTKILFIMLIIKEIKKHKKIIFYLKKLKLWIILYLKNILEIISLKIVRKVRRWVTN